MYFLSGSLIQIAPERNATIAGLKNDDYRTKKFIP